METTYLSKVGKGVPTSYHGRIGNMRLNFYAVYHYGTNTGWKIPTLEKIWVVDHVSQTAQLGRLLRQGWFRRAQGAFLCFPELSQTARTW